MNVPEPDTRHIGDNSSGVGETLLESWHREARETVDREAVAAYKAIGPRKRINPFTGSALWIKWATKAQLLRLSVLQARIERRQFLLKESEAEKRLIMRACTAKRRRSEGKT